MARATYTLIAGRAFVFSMSPDFQVDSEKVGDVTVYSYYYDYASFDIPGRLSLMTSAQALQIYSQRDAAYPHKIFQSSRGIFQMGWNIQHPISHPMAITIFWLASPIILL